MTLLYLPHYYWGGEYSETTLMGLVLIAVIAVIGFIVQARLQSVFNKYSKVKFADGMTGAEVAEKMLRDNGITDVQVLRTAGSLTDHFNPMTKTVNLSDDVYGSNSVAAAAVAAHECGHAVQHALGYAPLRLRSALVPLTSFSSRYSTWVILAGAALMFATRNEILFWIGIAMVAVSALFSIVTLPVEYDASRRALAWLEDQEILTDKQQVQAEEALMWAARTYLVAALSAIAVLIYWLGFLRRD
ncbi:MAG: zinc metallopeptidase [Rikenella sp.]|nr:zinc metallopeptidase [Rikenella sp.]